MTENAEPAPLSAAAATDAPTSLQVAWQWSSFDELTTRELYAIMHLRQLVFVVEQKCPYLDADNYDEGAHHLLGRVAGEHGAPLLGAYVRVLAPGVKYTEASIGRVVTHPKLRGTGLGRVLMREALRRTEALAPRAAIRIGAQLRLEKFYEEFGFRRVSDPYDDDGILHIEMLRAASQS